MCVGWMVREVFGNTSGMRTCGMPRVLMECHEAELTECHACRLMLQSVHWPHATLTGIDCARDRPSEISIQQNGCWVSCCEYHSNCVQI